MKQGKLIIGTILLVFLQLVVCRKNDVATSPTKTMTVSKWGEIIRNSDSVAREGDPVRFALSNSSLGNLQWKISPEPGICVINVDTIANIFFPKSGTYTITVRDSISRDSISFNTHIHITDYAPDFIYQHLDLDDVMSITPVISDASGVSFFAETQNMYRCNSNSVNYDFIFVKDTFFFGFGNVRSDVYCMTGNAKSKSRLYTGIYPSVLKEGKTYNVEMTFNKKIYRGSFMKRGLSYQFTWPYNDGVIFTKKHCNISILNLAPANPILPVLEGQNRTLKGNIFTD